MLEETGYLMAHTRITVLHEKTTPPECGADDGGEFPADSQLCGLTHMSMEKHEKKTPRQAAALKYDMENDRAPIVTAAGEGLMAERIVKEAGEHGVPW